MELQTRVNSLQAFRSGLARFIRYPQVLVSAYVLNLLSALLLVLVPALLLIKPVHYTIIRTAADGIDTWLVTELFMSTGTYSALQAPAPDWFSQGILVIVATILLIPLFAWIPASFLAGGTLLTYVEAPDKFSWRHFLWGCWHWFGTLFLVNLILGIPTQLLIGGLLIGMVAISSAIGSWVNWISVPLFALAVILLLIVLEYTRLRAVSGPSRNVLHAFTSAVAFVIRRPLTVAGFYVASLLILLLVHLVFRTLLLSDWVSWGMLFFIASQLFIVIRLSLRLVRWAGAAAIQ